MKLSALRGWVQDGLRRWIGWSLAVLGWALELGHRRRIRAFSSAQARLKDRYRITADTPVLEFGPEQEASIARWVEAHGGRVAMATTSGSTATPKAIAYPPARIAHVKWAFIDAFARAYAYVPLARKSLYVFSSITDDRSLTGLMLEERGLPPYLSSLQAPYRVQQHPAMKALAVEYGSAALRLLVIAVSNPGVLYATNPSTLAQFLDDLEARFDATRALVKVTVSAPESLPAEVRRILRRITSRGAQERLEAICAAERPLSLLSCAPALEAFITWDGGYVAPFLRRVEARLPGLHHIPMYSMSTETIETVPDYRRSEVAFLPLAPGVLYELLEEERPDRPEHLLRPGQAEVGKRYTMVVSDGYGLRRYQTCDVFRVAGMIDGLPDLRFERRRGLSYSFTGEKLTAQQIGLAGDRVRAQSEGALEGWFFSLVPALTPGEVPHYKLMLIGTGDGLLDPADLGLRFDRALGEINDEYKSKRDSGRLGPLAPIPISLEDFAKKIASSSPRPDWESQLKFLPLYPRLYAP